MVANDRIFAKLVRVRGHKDITPVQRAERSERNCRMRTVYDRIGPIVECTIMIWKAIIVLEFPQSRGLNIER